MDRKAFAVIEKEKELAKDFNKFTTIEKLRLIDESIPPKGKPSELADKSTLLKWQTSGVLDEYHTPRGEEDLEENFGYMSEVDEVQ